MLPLNIIIFSVIIFGLISIFILFAAIAYLRNILFLLSKIEEGIKEKLWPANWFWIAFIPFLGNRIYKNLKDLSDQPINLKLTPKRFSISNHVSFVDTNWVLFQEQYDRKTSAHHGTNLRFLDTNLRYQIIAAANGVEPRQLPNTIFVDVARKSVQNVLWAGLAYQVPNWLFSNHKTDVVIPIIDNSTNSVQVCSASQILFGREKFVVGLSQFQLILLPNLYVIWFESGYPKYHIISKQESITCGSRDATITINHSGIAQLHWKIKSRIMTVYQTIEYTKAISGYLVDLKPKEEILISPGDTFRIPGTDYRFRIDYQKI